MTDTLDPTALKAAAETLTATEKTGLSDYGSPERNGIMYARTAITAYLAALPSGDDAEMIVRKIWNKHHATDAWAGVHHSDARMLADFATIIDSCLVGGRYDQIRHSETSLST